MMVHLIFISMLTLGQLYTAASHAATDDLSLPLFKIEVDGKLVQGRRLPMFHSFEEHRAFVKTLELSERLFMGVSTRSSRPLDFHFEVCEVNYSQFRGNDLERVRDYLNSPEAHCRKLNEATFSENDIATKVDLTESLEAELDKQTAHVAQKEERSSANFKMIFSQIVSVFSFIGVNTAAHAIAPQYPVMAKQAASLGVLISAGLYVGTVLLVDQVTDFKQKHHTPSLMPDPKLQAQDQSMYLTLKLPAGLSAQDAVSALEHALDNATRKASIRANLRRSI